MANAPMWTAHSCAIVKQDLEEMGKHVPVSYNDVNKLVPSTTKRVLTEWFSSLSNYSFDKLFVAWDQNCI